MSDEVTLHVFDNAKQRLAFLAEDNLKSRKDRTITTFYIFDERLKGYTYHRIKIHGSNIHPKEIELLEKYKLPSVLDVFEELGT